MGRFTPVCQSCSRTFSDRIFQPLCPCGGMVDMRYDLSGVRLPPAGGNHLRRFFDLLPIREAASLRSVGEGTTPTVHSRELGAFLGLDKLYLKDESRNPTHSTKDRMASVVLSYFQELGIREFACSSTGNSSTSLAEGVERLPDFRLHVFVGRDFLKRMNFDSSERIRVYWVKDATFAEAHECAKAFARQNSQVTAERGFFNPARREGLKLAFLEAALDMPEAPHWHFQAVSSGMGVYGAWRGAQQLYRLGLIGRLPRLACIQQESCAPMVRSWRAGSHTTRPQDIVAEPQGVAEAILRGNPSQTYPHLREVVYQSGGTFEAVTESEILEAQRLILELEGIEVCPASATTVAAIRKLVATGKLRRDDVILANLTGGIRSSTITPREYVTVTKAEMMAERIPPPSHPIPPPMAEEQPGSLLEVAHAGRWQGSRLRQRASAAVRRVRAAK